MLKKSKVSKKYSVKTKLRKTDPEMKQPTLSVVYEHNICEFN